MTSNLKNYFIFVYCSAYEILFSDVLTGIQIPGGTTQFKGAEWASWTMTLGWAVQVRGRELGCSSKREKNVRE